MDAVVRVRNDQLPRRAFGPMEQVQEDDRIEAAGNGDHAGAALTMTFTTSSASSSDTSTSTRIFGTKSTVYSAPR